jgi:hypothetical protein
VACGYAGDSVAVLPDDAVANGDRHRHVDGVRHPHGHHHKQRNWLQHGQRDVHGQRDRDLHRVGDGKQQRHVHDHRQRNVQQQRVGHGDVELGGESQRVAIYNAQRHIDVNVIGHEQQQCVSEHHVHGVRDGKLQQHGHQHGQRNVVVHRQCDGKWDCDDDANAIGGDAESVAQSAGCADSVRDAVVLVSGGVGCAEQPRCCLPMERTCDGGDVWGCASVREGSLHTRVLL